MSTRNDVLQTLMDQEEAISGERLARRLGVSRNSVWKAIEQLRGEGYEIEAVTNRGYRLTGAPDRVTQSEIERWLKAGTIGARITRTCRGASSRILAARRSDASPGASRIWAGLGSAQTASITRLASIPFLIA